MTDETITPQIDCQNAFWQSFFRIWQPIFDDITYICNTKIKASINV